MSSRTHWDLRHRELASHPAPDPAAFLLECFPLLPRPHASSRALDLACGAGHNAVYLAERDWQVIAIDFSSAALDRAAALASSRHVPVHRSVSGPLPARSIGITLIETDLTQFTLPSAAFDLILCFQFLDRPLFPRIELALRPGGYLLYETFTELQLTHAEGPRNPDHLLRPGELCSALSGLEILFYRECQSPRAVASLFARR